MMAVAADTPEERYSFAFHLKSILTEEWHTDVTFLVGQDEKSAKEFKAHRVILAMQSPVFEAMLFNDHWIESKSEQIRIPDLTPEAFQELLAYCYETSHPQRSWKLVGEVQGIYQAANKYLMEHLVQECVDCMKRAAKQNLQCACYILTFADEFGIENLKEECLSSIVKQAAKAIRSRFGFVYLSAKYLQEILRRVHLCGGQMSLDQSTKQETALFEALLVWATEKCTSEKIPVTTTNMRSMLGTNLFLVNYRGMTPRGFLRGPGASHIFTFEEKFTILANILEPGCCALPVALQDVRRECPVDQNKKFKSSHNN